ncbi:MAG: PLDc_N domain-containing protein [Ardenticatenaceae bacterium]|nr:PLDc_N domain-containing protein [Ardenticatenaceae bacterium]
MTGLEWVQQNLALLLPLIILEFALIVAALFDLARRSAPRGPKWVWVLVIIFLNLIGPIAYFLVGRGED